jgi:hypothetical protein
MEVMIYEMDYSVSPGGINCWEADVYTSLGRSSNYSDFKTAGQALDYVISRYPKDRLEITVTSLEAYHLEMEEA